MCPDTTPNQWDFFIAYAGDDEPVAERLYTALGGKSRVFFARRSLNYGDDWDARLAAAQRASRITIVLISPHTDTAYYQREEIASAIDLSRKAEHRVVPIYLDGASEEDAPYGLRRKHAMRLASEAPVEQAARELLKLLPSAVAAVPLELSGTRTADTTPRHPRAGLREWRVLAAFVVVLATSIGVAALCWGNIEAPSGYRATPGAGGIAFANATLLDIVSSLSVRPTIVCPIDYLRGRRRVSLASAELEGLSQIAVRGEFVCDPCYPEQALNRFQRQFPACLLVERADSGPVSIKVNLAGVEPWTDGSGRQWQLCKVRAEIAP